MSPPSQSNKRRQAPFIDYYNLLLNVICNTLLTVKYCKEAYDRLRNEADANGSSVARKRCRVLVAKMSEPRLGSQRIADATGCSRNFVSALIHTYNTKGIDAVLKVRPKPGRPGRLNGHLDAIARKLDEQPARSTAEAAHVIREISGISVGLTWARMILRRCRFRFRKLQLKTGARRNRFNLLGCIDPFTLELVSTHSMMYVDAEQVKAFLEKVRKASSDLPVSVVLDNACYQHCRAVMEMAAELDMELVFLPPYSPNLNIIERLWKYTRKLVLAGRYFDTPAKFHEALRHFFDDDFGNHKAALKSLLTLNFQSFENAQLLCA